MKQIFIGGCGRSGTTFLGSLLGKHSIAVCTPESQFKMECLRFIRRTGIKTIDTRNVPATISNHWSYKTWALQSPFERMFKDTVVSYRNFIEGLVHAYAIKAGKAGAQLWVDHTPDNIQFVAALSLEFPEARFVHVIRDPRAVAASVMPLDWGPNTAYFAANWWVGQVSYGLAAESFFGPAKVLRVKYEELLNDTEQGLRRICAFAGVDYEKGLGSAGDFRLPLYTADQHTLVGKKPDVSRIDAWKGSLKPRMVELIENICADMLMYLGYELVYGLQGRSITDVERAKAVMTEAVRHLHNRFRHRWRLRLLNKDV